MLTSAFLNKSVILGVPFCVFAGYNVLTYANDSDKKAILKFVSSPRYLGLQA